MKRVGCALLAAVMLLALTACNGGGGKKTDPTDPDYFSIAATGDYSDGIMLPQLEDVNVSVMMSIDWNYLESNNDPSDPFAQYQATLIWRNAYPGGDVSITTITEEQMTEYLATQTASGTAPDIIPCNRTTYPQWNAAGLTASMEQYRDYLQLDAMDPTDPQRPLYNRDLMEQLYQWGGEIHGLVTLDEPDRQYIVFNKTKFENAGVKNPLEQWQDGEWTWTNFVKTAKALTSDEDFGFTGWGLFPYLAPYPMARINEEGKAELTIDEPNYMRYMTEVYNFYQVEGAGRNTNDDLQKWGTLFPAGTDAMVMTSLSRYQSIKTQAAKIQGDEFGVAPIFVFDPTGEEKPIFPVETWAYSISSASKNPVGAAAYIRLETLVSRNIAKSLEGQTWFDQNLTDEEKAMIEETKDDPILNEIILGIGNCYLGIIDAYIVPEIYYGETQNTVQAIFDAQKSALQAQFDEFNEMIDEVAAEKEAQEQASAAGG